MNKLDLTDILADVLIEYKALEACPIKTVANRGDFLVVKTKDESVFRIVLQDGR